MLEYTTRGIALQNEAFARFYHIQWLVKELNLALESPDLTSLNIKEFAREMYANICDTPVVASFDIVREFLERAWPSLADIHPKQMTFLSGAFRRFEACLENYDRLRGSIDEGLAGKISGADDVATYWDNMREFRDSIRKHAIDLEIYFDSLGFQGDVPTKK